MPFINDRINANKEIIAQANDKTQSSRQFRFTFNPEKVIATLKSLIVGQEHVIDALYDVLLLVKADFNTPHRPLSVILFTGPTGVGKTETVRVLADSILGDAEKICRIDMNTLAQEHYSSAITGSPPGYVGSKEGQSLFDKDKIKGRFSEPGIVLFDEIEKANQDVVRAMMNILDTGKLKLSSGTHEIDFSNAIIFMTSNIGAKENHQHITYHQKSWRRLLRKNSTASKERVDKALAEHFDPEFINRIDRVITFKPLEKDQFRQIIHIELEKLNARLKSRNAHCIIDDQAINYLSKHYDNRYGARDVLRHMRKELEPLLAKALLKFNHQEKFIITVKNQQFIASPIPE